jgi:hypothetical protein
MFKNFCIHPPCDRVRIAIKNRSSVWLSLTGCVQV